ncbi:MAG: hypothetical protein FWE22_01210 [Firmicutes bacterium]|nr:hypothetical protein [Bacillota bacterium]
MKILRVYTRRVAGYKNNKMIIIGFPPFAQLIPHHEEVNIFVKLNYNKKKTSELLIAWKGVAEKPIKLIELAK